jgi:hypothetical protein
MQRDEVLRLIVYVCMPLCIYLFACMYMYMHVCMCACTCTCIYVCMHVHAQTHTSIFFPLTRQAYTYTHSPMTCVSTDFLNILTLSFYTHSHACTQNSCTKNYLSALHDMADQDGAELDAVASRCSRMSSSSSRPKHEEGGMGTSSLGTTLGTPPIRYSSSSRSAGSASFMFAISAFHCSSAI